MKKIIILSLLFILCGCHSAKEEVKDKESPKEEINASEKEESYQDDNPIKLGLFLYDNNYHNKEVLEDTYYGPYISGTDIGSFEVFLTDEKVIEGNNFKDTWNKYYNSYSEDISNYKVGFNIKFILSDGTNYESNFLKPDIYKFSEYFYVYLYDDIHQEDGAVYSHLEEISEDNTITSIKIYAVDGIDKVENIILSVFTYDSDDDFDENDNYRGNSRYTIRIKKK